MHTAKLPLQNWRYSLETPRHNFNSKRRKLPLSVSCNSIGDRLAVRWTGEEEEEAEEEEADEESDRFVVPLGTLGCAVMLAPASCFIIVILCLASPTTILLGSTLVAAAPLVYWLGSLGKSHT
jgi:hypothetical protein